MTTTESILTQVKQATDYQINKRALKEKMLIDLHLPYNNGLFKLTPELMAFVATWSKDTLYLEDVYENPIELNRLEFLEKATQRYSAVMNSWHQQHEELKRIRKI